MTLSPPPPHSIYSIKTSLLNCCSVSWKILKYSSGKIQTRSPKGDQHSYGFTMHLTSAFDGAGQDAPDALPSRKMSGIPSTGGWVGLRASLDG